MPNIQVKNVPTEAHAVLRKRAAAAGQSLQEYLLDLVVRETATPTLDELFERVGHRTGGAVTAVDAVAAVRAERDER